MKRESKAMNKSQFTVPVCEALKGVREPQSGDVYKIISPITPRSDTTRTIPDDFFIVNHVRAVLNTGGSLIMNYEMNITLASILLSSLRFTPGVIGLHKTEYILQSSFDMSRKTTNDYYEFFENIKNIGFSDVVRFPTTISILVDYVTHPTTWRDLWKKTIELQ